MSVFESVAADSDGQLVRGLLAADNPRSARDQLRAQGLRVDDLQERSQQSSGWFPNVLDWGSGPLRWAETAHELATLLAVGILLASALDTLAQQSSGSFRRLLLMIHERVVSGASLAEALTDHPHVFDELSIQLVEVGETSGNLEHALDRLATFKLRWHGLRDQVVNALIYPAFVLIFGCCATLFLMTNVMPPLLDSLRETIVELPWPTLVVKGLSDLLLQYGIGLALLSLILMILAGVLLRSDQGRWYWDSMVLKLPLLGPLTVKQSMSRVSLILSTLLQSGVPLATALKLASAAVSNRVMKQALEGCQECLVAGGDVSQALARSAVAPPMAVQIFAVGQQTGKLEELLARLADDYDRQVQTAANRLASLLEPILILLLAGMIGFVLIAIVLPILEAGQVTLSS